MMAWWLLVVALSAGGDDPVVSAEKRLAQQLEQHFATQAKAYHFTLDEDGKQPLERHEHPIMRWTADGNYGSVWVWTERGRPQLIGCIGAFQNGAGQLEGFHEFQLMSAKAIPATGIGNEYLWQPKSGGPQPRKLTNAPEPAATHRLRLLQMRQLSRDFQAEMKSEGRAQQLRLSPAPLFEYESRDGTAVDGALFSFLWDKGTDPELLLLIELRKNGDQEQWHFVPLRFTWRELALRRHDEIVWQEGEQTESRGSRRLEQSYISCPVGLIRLPPETEELRNGAK
jgi:hypothetical protein